MRLAIGILFEVLKLGIILGLLAVLLVFHVFGATWFLVACLVAWVAHSRGRSPTTWLIIAILASPLIAGAVVMALPRDARRTARRARREALAAGMVACPDCAEMLPEQARVCRHCGFRYAMLNNSRRDRIA